MNSSKYKQTIISLFSTHHLLSINDVCRLLPQADYSTIYRNIESLESEGILTKLVFDTKRTLYELSEQHSPHYHFVCQECSEINEISIQCITLSQPIPGNVHTLVLYGECTGCAK